MTHFAVLIVVIVALALHALYFRPLGTNLLFLLFALPPAFVYDPTIYRFAHGAASELSAGETGAPLFNVFGFLFVFYTAWSLAVSIARRADEREVGFAPLLAWCWALATVMGFGLEFLNESLGWWILRNADSWMAYLGMWYWRPAIAFPLFLSLLIDDGRLRRRAFKACLIWAWVHLWDIKVLGSIHPAWEFAWIVFTVAALVHLNRCHRDGRIRLLIPVRRLTFDRPRSLFARRTPKAG